MKYPREKIDDPRTTHKGMIARWYETHDGMRRSRFSTLNYREVCQKHYGKALWYTLEGVAILRDYFFRDICLCPAMWIRS